MLRMIITLLVSALLSACASLPETLTTSNENVITDFQVWLNSPLEPPQEVRLGGVIAKVTNQRDQTRIEVVNMPISRSGRPDLNSEPAGRYVAYIEGYVEPLSFAKGRLVTFLGVTQGEEEGLVGRYPMMFRVMKVTGSYLWRIEESVIIDDIDSYYFPCHGLHCRFPRGLPRRGRVIQEVK